MAILLASSKQLFTRGFLLLAAVVIALMVWEREQRVTSDVTSSTNLQAPAPLFELNDQRGKPLRLKAYLGRERIVLLFYDGERGADRDPWLPKLAENYAKLERAGIRLFAISLATPFANREAEKRLGGEIPFPLLTDIDLRNPAPAPTHRAWGRYEEKRAMPLGGLFLIDRRGYTAVGEDGLPRPELDPEQCVKQLIRGEWPGS